MKRDESFFLGDIIESIEAIEEFSKGLTKEELMQLNLKQETVDLGEGKLLARYPQDLNPLYKNKAVGILYLGA